MAFQVGDRIAHPLHGAGVIDRIESRRINRETRDYYVLRLPGNGMTVMVPVDGCEGVGVRSIASPDEIERLFSKIGDLDTSMLDNWNKRYRENMQRIKSGDMLEVAAVVKGLVRRDAERGLSTGERRMLNSARQILLSEIVLSTDCTYEAAESRLRECLED